MASRARLLRRGISVMRGWWRCCPRRGFLFHCEAVGKTDSKKALSPGGGRIFSLASRLFLSFLLVIHAPDDKTCSTWPGAANCGTVELPAQTQTDAGGSAFGSVGQ